MPSIMYVNAIWMLPSLDHNLYLCPNYMCMLIYMGIYAHVYTELCTNAYHTLPVLNCWNSLVLLYHSLYYSWRKPKYQPSTYLLHL